MVLTLIREFTLFVIQDYVIFSLMHSKKYQKYLLTLLAFSSINPCDTYLLVLFCFSISLFRYVTYKTADGCDSVRMMQFRFFYRYIGPQPCYKTPLPAGTTGRLRHTQRRGWKGTGLYVPWLKQKNASKLLCIEITLHKTWSFPWNTSWKRH